MPGRAAPRPAENRAEVPVSGLLFLSAIDAFHRQTWRKLFKKKKELKLKVGLVSTPRFHFLGGLSRDHSCPLCASPRCILVHMERCTGRALSEASAAGSSQPWASVSPGLQGACGAEDSGVQPGPGRRTRLAGTSSSHAGWVRGRAPGAGWPVRAVPTLPSPTACSLALQWPKCFKCFSFPFCVCPGRLSTCALVSPQTRDEAGVARTVSGRGRPRRVRQPMWHVRAGPWARLPHMVWWRATGTA